jgi:hypothetical protein
MFVIWSGWGALTIVVGAVVQLSFGAFGYPQFAFLAASLGLFAAATANWVIGKRMNDTPARELIDPANGERLMLTRTHRLFWIRMEYRSIPVAVLALVPLLALPDAIGG